MGGRACMMLATVLAASTLAVQLAASAEPASTSWTFDASAEGWTADAARCAQGGETPDPPRLCETRSEFRGETAGNPPGSLWTALRSQGPGGGWLSGEVVWRSPPFALSADEVLGLEVELDRLPELGDGATAAYELRLADGAGAGTRLGREALESTPQDGEWERRRFTPELDLPAGEYRLEIHTTLVSDRGRFDESTAIGFDNIALLLPAPPAPTATPSPSPEPTRAPPPPPPPPPPVIAPPEPELGRTVRLRLLSGRVYVGSARKPLHEQRLVDVGTLVDASAGRVALEAATTSADERRYGRLMQGEFRAGAFSVHQSRTASLTELHLDGADQRRSARRGKARTAAKRRKRGKRLWGKARGRFRTVGKYSAATVRGTEWLTEERPEGTLVRVREGSVDAEELATGRKERLEAGDSFLGRPQCLSRRRFRIRLRVPAGTAVRAVSVRSRGRAAPIRRGRRLTALIDLRGVPRGDVTVRITVRTAAGRTLTGTRSYRTCSRPRAAGEPPEL